MPWITYDLTSVRQSVRDDIATSLRGATLIGNRVLRVMADAQAGLVRLVLKYGDFIAKNVHVATAEEEWLDRHADTWLVNADGTIGRKNPQPSSGSANFTGVEGIFVPEATLLSAPGITFMTTEEKTLGSGPTEIAIKAITPGANGNLLPGTEITLAVPISGVDSIVTVIDLRGGVERELTEDLRVRTLDRIRKPPMGGNADDYEQWAKQIPSVTRAYCAPREMGMGTITVRFMCDALRADTGGFPTEEDVQIVANWLNRKRPVAIKDFYVEAPIPEPINFNLDLGDADSLSLRAQVAASVEAMLREKARPAHHKDGEYQPGTTIYAEWVSQAIARVADRFTLTMTDHPMPNGGALAVLGTITYPIP